MKGKYTAMKKVLIISLILSLLIGSALAESWSLSKVSYQGKTYDGQELSDRDAQAHVSIEGNQISASASFRGIHKSGTATFTGNLSDGVTVSLAGVDVRIRKTTSGGLVCSALGATAYLH